MSEKRNSKKKSKGKGIKGFFSAIGGLVSAVKKAPKVKLSSAELVAQKEEQKKRREELQKMRRDGKLKFGEGRHLFSPRFSDEGFGGLSLDLQRLKLREKKKLRKMYELLSVDNKRIMFVKRVYATAGLMDDRWRVRIIGKGKSKDDDEMSLSEVMDELQKVYKETSTVAKVFVEERQINITGLRFKDVTGNEKLWKKCIQSKLSVTCLVQFEDAEETIEELITLKNKEDELAKRVMKNTGELLIDLFVRIEKLLVLGTEEEDVEISTLDIVEISEPFRKRNNQRRELKKRIRQSWIYISKYKGMGMFMGRNDRVDDTPKEIIICQNILSGLKFNTGGVNVKGVKQKEILQNMKNMLSFKFTDDVLKGFLKHFLQYDILRHLIVNRKIENSRMEFSKYLTTILLMAENIIRSQKVVKDVDMETHLKEQNTKLERLCKYLDVNQFLVAEKRLMKDDLKYLKIQIRVFNRLLDKLKLFPVPKFLYGKNVEALFKEINRCTYLKNLISKFRVHVSSVTEKEEEFSFVSVKKVEIYFMEYLKTILDELRGFQETFANLSKFRMLLNYEDYLLKRYDLTDLELHKIKDHILEFEEVLRSVKLYRKLKETRKDYAPTSLKGFDGRTLLNATGSKLYTTTRASFAEMYRMDDEEEGEDEEEVKENNDGKVLSLDKKKVEELIGELAEFEKRLLLKKKSINNFSSLVNLKLFQNIYVKFGKTRIKCHKCIISQSEYMKKKLNKGEEIIVEGVGINWNVVQIKDIEFIVRYLYGKKIDGYSGFDFDNIFTINNTLKIKGLSEYLEFLIVVDLQSRKERLKTLEKMVNEKNKILPKYNLLNFIRSNLFKEVSVQRKNFFATTNFVLLSVSLEKYFVHKEVLFVRINTLKNILQQNLYGDSNFSKKEEQLFADDGLNIFHLNLGCSDDCMQLFIQYLYHYTDFQNKAEDFSALVFVEFFFLLERFRMFEQKGTLFGDLKKLIKEMIDDKNYLEVLIGYPEFVIDHLKEFFLLNFNCVEMIGCFERKMMKKYDKGIQKYELFLNKVRDVETEVNSQIELLKQEKKLITKREKKLYVKMIKVAQLLGENSELRKKLMMKRIAVEEKIRSRENAKRASSKVLNEKLIKENTKELFESQVRKAEEEMLVMKENLKMFETQYDKLVERKETLVEKKDKIMNMFQRNTLELTFFSDTLFKLTNIQMCFSILEGCEEDQQEDDD